MIRDIRRPSRRSILSLMRRSGKVRTEVRHGQEAFESLEQRVLLAGDEPNFNQVFNTPSPVPLNQIPQIQLDVNGAGTGVTGQGSSVISPSGDDDVFRFTAPANDFVRIWADTLATFSTVDTRIEVYTGTLGGTPVLKASGSNNGPITSGVFKDGWVGFKAVQGTEYFIVVKSDVLSGVGSTGDYTLRVNALSSAFPAPSAGSGETSLNGTITLRGSDQVYKLVIPTNASFRGLMTLIATSVATDFDPRLDIYNTNGTFIVGDSDSGNLTDSYLALASTPNTTYYIRVRSDEIGDPNTRPSTGAYTINLDAIATNVTIDPVTRRSANVGGALGDQKSAVLYSFTAQGTGLSFISLAPAGLPPIPDSALRLYNEAGTQIAFNELPGATSRMLINLVGGTRYFLVVEAFDAASGGGYSFSVEAHHTYDQSMTQPVDDHVNTPAGTGPADARIFELATPLIWGQPQDAPTPILDGPALLPPPPSPAADHVKVVIAKGQGRIHDAGDTDLFQFVPPVDMLGNYEGLTDGAAPPTPPLWQAKYRPATRLQIFAFPMDAFMASARIRVFDSNFNLVYGPNTNVLTGVPGVSGMLDPASWPPALPFPPYPYNFAQGQPGGIEVWGGEVYYLEISSGGGSGRYSFNIQADAPQDKTGVDATNPQVTTAGNYGSAYEIRLDANTGEGRNYNNVQGGQLFTADGVNFTALTGNGSPVLLGRAFSMNRLLPVPPPAGTGASHTTTPFTVNPGTRGRGILRMSDLGNITSPTDTDLYQFRALYSGTAEVRLNTTNLADEFWEGTVETEDGDPMTPPVQTTYTPKTKTYNSPLDGALRIFDNDQTEIAFNNDNGVTGGESDTTNSGSFANRTFQRRDARVVFPVEAGRIYFIQVESGQRSNFSLVYPNVDWRHATGSYELLVNSMLNLNFDDDHVNGESGQAIAQATVIPNNLSVSSTTDIIGSVDGEILNTLANTADNDIFTFIASGDGTARFTLSTRGDSPTSTPDSFSRILSVFNFNGTVLLGQVAADGAADANVSVSAVQGDRFFIRVDGNPNGAGPAFQGRYTIKASGVPFKDDHASEDNFIAATSIAKDSYDYDGTETVAGALETTGDTDIFTFQSLDYDNVTVSVAAATGLRPFIRIWEISIDPNGNPIRLQIANNGDTGGTFSASVSFSVTAPPRTTGGQSYPYYYIVVSGVDPNLDKGTYNLTLSFNKTTDDHPDGPNPPPPGTATIPGQFPLASPIALGPTGNGASSGRIELSGDSDLFTFTAASQGQAIISVSSPSNSQLLPRIRIIDSQFNAVTDITTGQFFVTGDDAAISVATFTFTSTRNAVYYVMIEGVASVGNTFKIADTGAYTLSLTIPVPDDHPNVTEFDIATDIPLSQFSGDGSATGQISPNLDTDLFKFTSIIAGNMVITLTTPGSQFTPILRLFDPSRNEIGTAVIDGGPGDEDGQVNGSVKRTIPILATSTYWVLVSSDQGGIQAIGGYSVILDGPTPPHPSDDHANAGDYQNATQIILDQSSGDATATGIIETGGDTDLFYFTSLAGSPTRPLPAFIQVVTPNGQLLDVGIRIIADDQSSIITTDTGGGPGYNAGVQFDITAPNQRYYIEVDGLATLTGSYTVRIDTSPETYFLYYPEGFSNDAIREYVSIGNGNDFDVNYTITFRYEDPNLAPVSITGVALANKRGGFTVSDGDPTTNAIVAANKPYAIIIESDGFLGANISHYDFGNTLGEAFTGRTSTQWSFAKGNKFPGSVNDFLLYYNPNPTPAVVTLIAYKPDGSTFSTGQVVQGNRRFGWNFNDTPALPLGQFAFTVTSAPLNPGDDHVGIVASLSHYDLDNSDGYAVLGDPDAGTTTGVIPGLIDSGNLAPSQKSEITLYNNSSSTATVGLVGKYLSTGIPDLIRPITLAPHESITLTGTQLGLVANQTVGLRYDSNQPITVLTSTRRFGDSDATQAQTQAGTKWFFGDAFINRLQAGNKYFENMYFYNPDSSATTINLRFVFNVGNESSYSFNVPAKGFASVALHDLAAILNHAVFNYFSIIAGSSKAFSVSMTHYDLNLGGGWGTGGAPLGLTNSLSSIT